MENIQKVEWFWFAIERGIDLDKFNYLLGGLKNYLDSEMYIAGGFLCDIICGREPKDIDLFFANERKMRETNKAMFLCPIKLDFPFDSSHPPVGFQTNEESEKLANFTITHPQFGFQTVEERIKLADFTVTQFVFDGTFLYFGENSLGDLDKKRLVVNFPNNSFDIMRKRYERYRIKGFALDYESSLDNYYRRYLEEFTGIREPYFTQTKK
ncbi:MAG TPA: hypothetical protein DG757_20250 [Bacillus sp. (in: Bacteria)]|uniref:hypothetical protein n=1 Tax=Lysinibacillus sphaericus TaxID=1421 RepID=UPI00056D590F|nr:hypothetical protein [Lysinibacillus sphaericus]QTB24548.1 hypothetical protein J1907_11205 [Lysinibacillus sphaericus]HCX51307.1 hypothetical protein [Bacillus sp. (in: firmicutes)]